jgi:DNA-binding MarR family transcriptional regulator
MAKADPQPFDLHAALGDIACTQMALRRAARRLSNLYDEAVAQSGLKATQVSLMARIQALDGPTLQTLAEAMAIELSSLTYALRPLVRDGLVTLTAAPGDRRAKHARLTPLGLQRLAGGIALWRAANQRTEAVLGEKDARKLRKLADRVASDGFLEAYAAKV